MHHQSATLVVIPSATATCYLPFYSARFTMPLNRHSSVFLSFLLGALALSSASQADVLFLKDGRVISGKLPESVKKTVDGVQTTFGESNSTVAPQFK